MGNSPSDTCQIVISTFTVDETPSHYQSIINAITLNINTNQNNKGKIHRTNPDSWSNISNKWLLGRTSIHQRATIVSMRVKLPRLVLFFWWSAGEMLFLNLVSLNPMEISARINPDSHVPFLQSKEMKNIDDFEARRQKQTPARNSCRSLVLVGVLMRCIYSWEDFQFSALLCNMTLNPYLFCLHITSCFHCSGKFICIFLKSLWCN